VGLHVVLESAAIQALLSSPNLFLVYSNSKTGLQKAGKLLKLTEDCGSGTCARSTKSNQQLLLFGEGTFIDALRNRPLLKPSQLNQPERPDT
jgi:hypothetical protein